MVDRTAYLNTTQPSFNPSQHENHRDLKRQLHEELCKKMAVISVDLIKNQTITSNVLAKAQQGDDLLSTIRENIHTDQIRNQSYVLKNQVLYRTYCNPNNKIVKYALCVPDVLLPAVIHHLHILLGHATYSTMLKNFRAYYHAPMAQNLIKQYVAACTTCALANKYDIKKVVSSVERTIKSSRPRQHLYADLIPMYKGTFSYVLFALDTYSQFVYAIPLKDKTATSVLQGFLAIFGTTGWYENIYLDDETSFEKAAKMLTKVAPIQVHYSTPYCHFQNSSENYIKHFKKTFLKILNDHENPQENSDWPLLLPTVTQAMNRQIIANLGVTRENIHFNTATEFYPLAELVRNDDAELNAHLDNETLNHFKTIVLQRKKRQKHSNKIKVPQYTEKAIVFMRDMIPSASNIQKIPQKGPFQISDIDEKTVTLIEPETGETVHTRIELIRPIDLKEFRLLLNKKWDLNLHHPKAIDQRVRPGIFDEPTNPIPLTDITDEIPSKAIKTKPLEDVLDEIELEQLFYPPPKNMPKVDILGAEKNPPNGILVNPPEFQFPTNQCAANTNHEVKDKFDTQAGAEKNTPTENSVLDPLIDQNLAYPLASAQNITDELDQTEANTANALTSNLSQINSLHAFRDLSKPFKDTLKTKQEKMITFFLSKNDQYIKLPSGETEID